VGGFVLGNKGIGAILYDMRLIEQWGNRTFNINTGHIRELLFFLQTFWKVKPVVSEKGNKDAIKNPSHLFEYLKVSRANLSREEFRLLHLNRSKHLIAEEVLFRGTVDESAVYTREVVESALRKKASALILAHNHPTGLPEASEEDIKLTESLIKACWTVDIPIVDHIIIGRGGFLSMKHDYPEKFEGDNEVA
jgi:DNA repair protein RadC